MKVNAWRLAISAAAVLGLGLTAGCGDGGMSWGTKRSLYERLGGEAAIKAVVDDFVARISENPKVNITRKGSGRTEWQATPANVDRVKKLLVEQICSATGGPQKYSGRDMKTVHAGMNISDAEFDAAGADLKATLDKFKVPAAEQDELMKIIVGTRGDIVERPAAKM
ncbi:MAG: group 1 truncated hemoglobin [Phycisphaerae bacterium]|nr:group 1 truncated hemoglobin [Phycisphaerae bacterium]